MIPNGRKEGNEGMKELHKAMSAALLFFLNNHESSTFLSLDPIFVYSEKRIKFIESDMSGVLKPASWIG
jgi:hypothetical protein